MNLKKITVFNYFYILSIISPLNGDGVWTKGEEFEDLNGNNIWDLLKTSPARNDSISQTEIDNKENIIK